MKIAVVSDSHNNEKAIELAKKYINDVDILLFLGDGEEDLESLTKDFQGQVYAVKGNCDISKNNPDERMLLFHGKRIFMCHGHRYNVKFEYNSIYYRGREVEADIVLFGHSHKSIIENINGMVLMNPGSVSHGPAFCDRTMGFIELEEECPPMAYLQVLKN